MKHFLLFPLLLLTQPAFAVTFWSTQDSLQGTGRFHGPGNYTEEQTLFPETIRDMVLVSRTDLVTPFFNNGAETPNVSGERVFAGKADGKLSNGLEINENVDTGVSKLSGQPVLFAVTANGSLRGEQVGTFQPDGQLTMSMDMAIDMGTGEKGVITLPLQATTGTVTIPKSLQTQQGQAGGIDQAGALKSGATLTGRLGDFNNDGWIDGTLVSAGVFPLDAPVHAGQPYAMERHFETNLPVDGAVYGSTQAVHQSYQTKPPKGNSQ